jgi:hypothetical protein
LDIAYSPALRGCDDSIGGGYEHDRTRAFGKVGLGREHLLADGLCRKNRTARIHGEVQVSSRRRDVEQVAS